MSNNPITMLQLRRILQLLANDTSHRKIARVIHISRNTVAEYAKKITQTGKTYQDLLQLSDGELSILLYTPTEPPRETERQKDFNDRMEALQQELSRPHVTRWLLWREYLEKVPNGYGYTQFCERLNMALQRQDVVMHFDHKPGESLQFDFAGDHFTWLDSTTGFMMSNPVLVFVLPFSGYTYLEALPSAHQQYVFVAMNHCMEYLGGVPQSLKSDNMRQYVCKPDRYEPCFTILCEQWSLHYDTTLMAARVRKPRDKPSVENGVNCSYTRIYAPLRNESFTGLVHVNHRLHTLLEEHNRLMLKKRPYSRWDQFVQYEQKVLKPLPAEPFQILHQTQAKVQRNYHVILGEDMHQYSVPPQYVGKDTILIYNLEEVEVFLDHRRIVLHRRDRTPFGYTTLPEHMPEKEKRYLETRGWNGQYFTDRAAQIGVNTQGVIERILSSRGFVEQTYNSCLGVLRMAEKYGHQRMETACSMALVNGYASYKIIRNILQHNLDLKPQQPPLLFSLPVHPNLRGASAYR